MREYLHYNFLAGQRTAWKRFVLPCDAKTGHEGGVSLVSEIRIGDNDSFETALKRFNRKVQQDGILAEARRREHYEKPSMKRKRKEATRQRKLMRKAM